MSALYLGLISGTSADAVDAALVDFSNPAPRLIAARATPYPPNLRTAVLQLALGNGTTSLDQLGALDEAIAEHFASCAEQLLRSTDLHNSDVNAIGSHGQTVWHRPYAAIPYTIQLGDPSRIAERTGCRVVADFRRRDLAAGGQGAPLMSAFHAAILAANEARAVLNLGGIANLTLLPSDAGAKVRGFDTGPASCLLDAWAQRHTGMAIDHEGRLAASGRCDEALLRQLLREPYFGLAAPKSTGREVFNLDWLHRCCDPEQLAPADVQATLVELTAATIAQALQREAPDTQTVIACGGGVHNPALMTALARTLAPVRLCNSSMFAINPDYVEAMGFAWLARETLAGRPGNLPAVTGARGPRILGGIYPA